MTAFPLLTLMMVGLDVRAWPEASLPTTQWVAQPVLGTNFESPWQPLSRDAQKSSDLGRAGGGNRGGKMESGRGSSLNLEAIQSSETK